MEGNRDLSITQNETGTHGTRADVKSRKQEEYV